MKTRTSNSRGFTVKSHSWDYAVSFETDLCFLDGLKEKDGIWIVDRNVHSLYPSCFGDVSDRVLLFDAMEEEKTPDRSMRMCKELATRSIRRNTILISVGGGITQDVSGFVASVMFRGLDWVFVPTTLLAQTDSCIGSKTSLNFGRFKNILGTFFSPRRVFVCQRFLDTLREIDFYSGFGEIVKLQLIKARSIEDLSAAESALNLVSWRENRCSDSILGFVHDCLLVKKGYIEEDEFDYGIRRLLNYGHCFGHAIESVSRFEIPHGLAVIIGIIFAYIIAEKRGVISSEESDFVINRILLPHLHLELMNLKCSYFDCDELFSAMKRDKKRTGGNCAAIIIPKQGFQLQLVQDLSYDESVLGVAELKNVIDQNQFKL